MIFNSEHYFFVLHDMALFYSTTENSFFNRLNISDQKKKYIAF